MPHNDVRSQIDLKSRTFYPTGLSQSHQSQIRSHLWPQLNAFPVYPAPGNKQQLVTSMEPRVGVARLLARSFKLDPPAPDIVTEVYFWQMIDGHLAGWYRCSCSL